MTAWTNEAVQDDPLGYLAFLTGVAGLPAGIVSGGPLDEVDPEWATQIKDRLAVLGYTIQPSPRLYAADPYGLKGPLEKFQEEAGLEADGVYAPETAELLEALTDWEGLSENIELPDDLERDGKPAYIRSLQYRLKTLGFYRADVDGVFGLRTREAVREARLSLGGGIGQSPERIGASLFRFFADPYALNAAILDALGDQPLVVCHWSWLTSWLPRRSTEELTIRNDRFENRTEGFLRIASLGKSVSPPKAINDRPANQAAKHLLQLWLWMLSHYFGGLDGIFHDKSIKALRALLAERHLPEEEFIVFADKFYVLIAPAVFRILGVKRPSVAEVENAEGYLVQQTTEALNSESVAGPGEETGLFHRLWYNLKDVLKDLKKIGRYIYTGTNTVILAAGRALAAGAQWVWQQLGYLGRSALHVMSRILAGLRSSWSRFWREVKQLVNFLNTMCVSVGEGDRISLTVFTSDFDVTNLSSKLGDSETADLVKEHRRELAKQRRVFGRACRLVAAVCRVLWIILACPTNPLGVAILIASEIKKVIREYDSYALAQ